MNIPARIAAIHDKLERHRPGRLEVWTGNPKRLRRMANGAVALSFWLPIFCAILLTMTARGETVLQAVGMALFLGSVLSAVAGLVFATCDFLPDMRDISMAVGERALALRGLMVPMNSAQAERLANWASRDGRLKQVTAMWLVGRQAAVLSHSEFKRLERAHERMEKLREEQQRLDEINETLASVRSTFDKSGIAGRARAMEQSQAMEGQTAQARLDAGPGPRF